MGAFHLVKTKYGNFGGNKNGFSDRYKIVPFDCKPPYGAEPISRWDTKMVPESVTIETGINQEKRVHGT